MQIPLVFFKLFEQEAKVNWVIFHDVLVTSRVYMRTVCPIRYEWVKDLLPKLHEVDVYDLSNVAREEVTNEEITKWEKREAAKRQAGGFPQTYLLTCLFVCLFIQQMLLTLSGLEPRSGFKLCFWSNLNLCNYT